MLELFTFNVATALILVGICAIYLLFVRRGKRLPPGPPGYPLIGNILDLDPRNMISQYQRLREEYGDVFCLKLFHRLSILVNGREAITELFVKHADAMSDRPDNLFAYLITQGLGKRNHVFPSNNFKMNDRGSHLNSKYNESNTVTRVAEFSFA